MKPDDALCQTLKGVAERRRRKKNHTSNVNSKSQSLCTVPLKLSFLTL